MVDVMALLEESALDEGQRCHTCRWLETRPDDERQKWVEALDQPKTWPATQVMRAMRRVPDAGRTPTTGSILNHRGKHQRQIDGGSRRTK
jgi:hypothetical protein